jgi:hypothetical protein
MTLLVPFTVYLMWIAAFMLSIVKPGWLTSSIEHKLFCLLSLKRTDLKACCLCLSITISCKEHNKHGWSSGIVNAFEKHCNELIGKTTSELIHYLSTLHLGLPALDSDFYMLLVSENMSFLPMSLHCSLSLKLKITFILSLVMILFLGCSFLQKISRLTCNIFPMLI